MRSTSFGIAHGLRTVGAFVALVMGSGIAVAAPQIAVTPDPIWFGEVWLYPGDLHQVPGTVSVQNTGDAPLAVSDMRILGTDADQFVFDDPACSGGQDCATGYTLAVGESRTFGLLCAPSRAGYLQPSFTVTSNAAAGAATVGMYCASLGPPVLEVSPASLTFPVARGETGGSSLTLTVSNAATDPAAPLDYTITGAPWQNPQDFTVYSGCNPTSQPVCEVTAGTSETFEIWFHPQGAVVYSGPITITPTPSWGIAPVSVPLFAQGDMPRFVAPVWVSLGTTPVGQPITGTVTAHNDSLVQLHLWSTYATAVIGELAIVDGPTGNYYMQPGEDVTWTVSCTPSTFEGVHGQLVFDTDTETGTFYTFVSCDTQAASLTFEPAAAQILFGTVEPGASATTRKTLRNQGNAATELVAITSDDPHFTTAVVGGTLPVSLPAGASVDVDVTFTPTSADPVAAWITFDASVGGDAQLRVFGDSSEVTPPAHDFGAVTYPATPSAAFAIDNASEVPVTISAVTLDAPADFAVAGLPVGTVIAPATSAAFDVTVTPSRLGARHATLTIGYGGLAGVAVPLDALAIDPALTVTTGDATADDYALDAGAVDVNVGPRVAHVTLHASGAPVTITSCAVTGAAAFAVSSCPGAIAAGESADVAIAFDPDAEASYAGALEVRGDGFGTGVIGIALAGTGLDQHVALSALALDFPDTFRYPTTPTTQQVTVQNTAAMPLVLGAITVTGDGFARVGPSDALLAPGASTDVTVSFAPTMAGAFTGELVLGNADDPAIARVALTGRGIDRAVDVTPASVALGDVTIGKTVTLGDLGGSIAIRDLDAAASFTITRATITGTGGTWALIGPSPDVIAPGGAASLDVSFTAAEEGTQSATIEIYLDGDPAPQARVTATANGVKASPGHRGGCAAADGDAGWLVLALGALAAFRPRAPRCRGR